MVDTWETAVDGIGGTTVTLTRKKIEQGFGPPNVQIKMRPETKKSGLEKRTKICNHGGKKPENTCPGNAKARSETVQRGNRRGNETQCTIKTQLERETDNSKTSTFQTGKS